MKHLLLYATLIVSCTNPKAEIVDRLRAAKDSVEVYDSKLEYERYALPKRISDSMKKVHPIWNERDIQYEIDQQTLQSEIDGQIDHLTRKKYLFQREYDSLEFELKKY
jgi:hypothetical protein